MILNEGIFTEAVIDEYDMFSVCGTTKDGCKKVEEFDVEYTNGDEENPVYYNKVVEIYKGDGTTCHVGRRSDSGKFEIIPGNVFFNALGAADTSKRSFGLFDKFLEAIDKYYIGMYTTRPENDYTKFVITIPNRFNEIFSSLGDGLDVFGPADAIVDSANMSIRDKNLGEISTERNGLRYTIIFPSTLDDYFNRASVGISDTSDANAKAIATTKKIIANLSKEKKRKLKMGQDSDELDFDESFKGKAHKCSEDMNLYKDEYFDDLLSEDADGEDVEVESLVNDVVLSVKELANKAYLDGNKRCPKELAKKLRGIATYLNELVDVIGDACEDGDMDEEFDLGDTIHDVAVAAAPAVASAAIPLLFV